MTSVTITLPLPDKVLSPNARCHWAVKSKATRSLRELSKWSTFAETSKLGGMKKSWRTATVQARFYFRDKRRRDTDNMLASLKAAFDGLKDSGLIVDDSGLTHLPVQVAVDKANPRVELTITNGAP